MPTDQWQTNAKGIVRKNSLLRAKLTVTALAQGSLASVAVGDYYEFPCKSKGLPSFADAPTWTDVTDDPNELTGFAYAGKPEQIDPIEIVTRTPLMAVYDKLLQHYAAGDLFTLLLTYSDPHETYDYTVTLLNCQICGLNIEAGENNAGSQTTIKLLAEGGISANIPAVAEVTRPQS